MANITIIMKGPVDPNIGEPAAGGPVLAFSDIISAPASGWSAAQPTKGAVITVWGRGFGATRGSSYITVDGVNLTSGSDYLDTWAKTSNPIPWLQSITFQLNDSMAVGAKTISVTVDGVTSNTLPLRINSANIRFIDVNASGAGTGTLTDPWDDPDSFVDSWSPGDVGYIRAGLLDVEYETGKANIWARDSNTSGTAQDPISLVAYPGETVTVDCIVNGDETNFNRNFQIDCNYITIAKFTCSAILRSIWLKGDYNRAVGNDCIGAQFGGLGSGILHSGGQGPVFLGNAAHGGRSGDRLDHAIYIDGCQDIAGGEIAYNYAYDCFFGRGPLLVDNHQVNRCAPDEFMQSNHWHSNLVVGSNTINSTTSRGIGAYDFSWDEGEANEPEPGLFYNNILVDCGQGFHGAIYHQNGHARFYNNTLIDNEGKGFQLFDTLLITSEIINNVIIQASGITDDCINVNSNQIDIDTQVTIDRNSYFNGSAHVADNNPITADPEITYTEGAYNPVVVAETSPLINAGNTAAVSSLVTRDFYLKTRTGNYDVGAVEP